MCSPKALLFKQTRCVLLRPSCLSRPVCSPQALLFEQTDVFSSGPPQALLFEQTDVFSSGPPV